MASVIFLLGLAFAAMICGFVLLVLVVGIVIVAALLRWSRRFAREDAQDEAVARAVLAGKIARFRRRNDQSSGES